MIQKPISRAACFLLLALALPGNGLAAPRVITLAPHLTELVFAAGAGDRLVGVVAWSDYPPEASGLPSIGDAFRFDLERILGLEPDIILAWAGGTPPAAVARMIELGLRVEWVRTASLADIANAIELLGHWTDSEAQARASAERYRAALAALAEQAPAGTGRRVFYQVAARPLYTLGGRHVINEVLALCGMENIFAALDTEAAVVDMEAVISARPALILISQESGNPDPAAIWRDSGLLPSATRVVEVDPTALIRPTPRIVDGIQELCAID